MKTHLHFDSVRHLSINQFALLASAIGGIVIVSGFVLLAINAQLTNLSATATAKATVSESSLNQERAEERAWLAQRNAMVIDTKATAQRQEELKEQWLPRSTSVAPATSPMQDRKEELAFLAARANAQAMADRQEELKDQWLAHEIGVWPEPSAMQDRKEELIIEHRLIAPLGAAAQPQRIVVYARMTPNGPVIDNSITVAIELSPMQDRKEELAFLAARANAQAMVERQEELKEQWLAQRSLTAAPFVAPPMHQEALKDQWLERRTR